MRAYYLDIKYGVAGDGITDDTQALQCALDCELNLNLGDKSKSYKISSPLLLRSGHSISGRNCRIKQDSIRTETIKFEYQTDIIIDGLQLDGYGNDFSNSPSSKACGIRGRGSKRVLIKNNWLNNFSCSGIFLDYAEDSQVTGNIIVGPGQSVLTPIISGACYGIVMDGNRNVVHSNTISKTAQGVATGDNKSNNQICNNTIFDIVGQHGIYAGSGQTNLLIANNNINNIKLIGIKVQNYDATAQHADNICITGNNIASTGSQGIAVLSSTTNAIYKLRNVVVTGNTIRNAGEDGVNLTDIVVGNISGNSVYNAAREGITILKLNSVLIASNTIMATARNGIRESGACTGCSLVNNMIKDCATGGAVGERNGILLQLGDTFVISGNIITDSTSKMQYGIFISGGYQNSHIVMNNVCRGMSDYGARFKTPSESIMNISGNFFSGNLGSTFNLPI